MKLLFRQKKGGDLWRNDNSIDNLSSDEMMIEWRNDNSWSIITSDEMKRDWQNDIINNLLPPLYDFNINQCEFTWLVCWIIDGGATLTNKLLHQVKPEKIDAKS